MGIWRIKMRTHAEVDYKSDIVIGLIPARWKSTRFEGKPLVDIAGVPMIRRVYDRASIANHLDQVIVLTDDMRINDYCQLNQMTCIVIEEDCRTGTDRCAHALKLLDGSLFVNIQGDEPLINPSAIDNLIENFDNNIGVANAYTKIDQEYKLNDRNVVKVVFDKAKNALYSSRLPISDYQQLGLYAFNGGMLDAFSKFTLGELEIDESIEMLRYLENGFNVKMVEVEDEGLSVDTPNDLKLVELKIKGYH